MANQKFYNGSITHDGKETVYRDRRRCKIGNTKPLSKLKYGESKPLNSENYFVYV